MGEPKYRAEYASSHGPMIFEGTEDDCHGVATFTSTEKRDEFLRAVNAHEALVEALADCVESLQRLPSVDGAYRITCLSQARAALERARSVRR